MNDTLKRMYELIEEKNLTPAQATRIAGLAPSSFTDWKNGRGKPSLDAVKKFSEHFHVSIDYLVNGEEFKSGTNDYDLSNPKEISCIKKFRKLSPALQDRLLSFADGMIAAMPDSESGDEKRLSV